MANRNALSIPSQRQRTLESLSPHSPTTDLTTPSSRKEAAERGLSAQSVKAAPRLRPARTRRPPVSNLLVSG